MSRTRQKPDICDYEGSDYRTRFWEGKGRDYEDRVERRALQRLLPRSGRRLLEVGAGFGRLTNEYAAYEQVVLLDYSLSQLQYAQEHLGRDPRFVYVAADAYHLPFLPGVFDGATMIRVIHHFADVPSVLAQVRRALTPGGTFILEHANKRNLKSMLRYALKKQSWNPYDLQPVEFVELNFDFHPDYMQAALRTAGFSVGERIPVSFFRLPILKERVPVDLLVGLDTLMQNSGLLYSPSIFAHCTADASGSSHVAETAIFRCPECGGELLREGDILFCPKDNLRWAIRDGIYDFKAPLDEPI
jgi:SAM-dependent methyltransferase